MYNYTETFTPKAQHENCPMVLKKKALLCCFTIIFPTSHLSYAFETSFTH